jgi:hypothetical protein
MRVYQNTSAKIPGSTQGVENIDLTSRPAGNRPLSPLPSRLIDFGLLDRSQKTILYEVKMNNCTQYTTLGHCWRFSGPIIRELKTPAGEILDPGNHPAKNLRDTVSIRRRMRILYSKSLSSTWNWLIARYGFLER